jgi:hypothetical protein
MVQKLQPNDNKMNGLQNKSKGTNNVLLSHFQIGHIMLLLRGLMFAQCTHIIVVKSCKPNFFKVHFTYLNT